MIPRFHSRFAVDVKLDADHIHGARDDISLRTLSLTACPLFVRTPCGVAPLAVAETAIDGTQVRLRLRPGLRYQDGLPVRAEDYQRTYDRILKDPTHPASGAARLIGRLLTVGPETLVFALRHPLFLSQVEALLSIPSFSPEHPGDRGLSAGAYVLASANGERWTFVRNPHAPFGAPSDGRMAVDHLEALLVPCHLEAVRLFEAGALELTCDTQFPAGGLIRWGGTPFLWEGEGRIGVSLDLDAAATPLVRDPMFWSLLRRSVSLGEMAADLGGCVVPFVHCNGGREGLTPLQPPTSSDAACGASNAWLAPRWAELLQRHGSGAVRLGVAYDPFFPNLAMVEALSGVLEPFGVRLDPEEDDYVAPWRRCPLRLRLWSTPLETALGLYLAREPSLRKDLASHLRHAFLAESLAAPVQQMSLDRVWLNSPLGPGFSGFAEATLGAPLFVLRNASLRQPGLDHGGFAPGHVWSLCAPGVAL